MHTGGGNHPRAGAEKTDGNRRRTRQKENQPQGADRTAQRATHHQQRPRPRPRHGHQDQVRHHCRSLRLQPKAVGRHEAGQLGEVHGGRGLPPGHDGAARDCCDDGGIDHGGERGVGCRALQDPGLLSHRRGALG